jgi:putative membrane protein
MRFVTRVLLAALALMVVAAYVPGITVTGVFPAIAAALILGFLNFLVRPILIVLTLPVTVLTLGLFILIINAVLFSFAAAFIAGFSVDSFRAAFIGSVLVSLISAVGNRYIS